jgi:hypothetical protein
VKDKPFDGMWAMMLRSGGCLGYVTYGEEYKIRVFSRKDGDVELRYAYLREMLNFLDQLNAERSEQKPEVKP